MATITQGIESVREKFPDARAESDGSITLPECPGCRDEGHHHKSVKLFVGAEGRINGISCSRFSSAGPEANNEHVAPLREQLGLSPSARSGALVEQTLFAGDRRVTLELEAAARGKQLATARNCSRVLAVAEVNLALLADRAAFVASLTTLTGEEREVVSRELVQLLDRYRRVRAAVEDEATPEDERESAATRLVKLAEEAQLVHDQNGDGFAVLRVGAHKETHKLRSKGFKQWLTRRFFETFGKVPNAQAVQDALTVIEAKAVFEGPERRVFLRVGERDGRVYLDLCDDEWRAVEVDADGWRVVDIPPVEFRRARGMLPLPVPERGGSLEELRPFLNLDAGDLWALTLGSLVMKLHPRGPYPVDVYTGAQGCGKTTRARINRSVVDPSVAAVRGEPRELRDLQIAASNEWLPVLDNLSKIQPWLSDGLCCLSTGAGLRTRELYSDGDEAIFAATRPVILTAITEVVERPDLLDRAVIFNLPEIDRKQRLPEKRLWAEFEAARPRILGALLDAVSCALRNEESVVIEEASRMADFERWATAAEPALGLKPGAFLRAYRKNQNSASELALEACPITEQVIALAEAQGVWVGTARELFDLLLTEKSEEEKRKLKEQGWPKAPNGLSAMLRRLAPNLRMHGVGVEFNLRTDKKGSRKIRLAAHMPDPDSTPDPDSAGDSGDEPEYRRETPSEIVRPPDGTENKGLTGNPSDDPRLSSDDHGPLSDDLADLPGNPSDDLRTVSDGTSDDVAARTLPPQAVGNAYLTAASDGLTMTDGDLQPHSGCVEYVGMDVETTPFTRGWDRVKTWRNLKAQGKRPVTPQNAEAVGLAVAYGPGQAEYVTDRERWPLEATLGEGQTAVFFNYKFDAGVMERAGLPLPERWECGYLAARLIDEHGPRDLKSLAEKRLGIDKPMTYAEAEKLRLLDPAGFAAYARADAANTLALWPLLKRELEAQGLTRVYELEKRLVPVVRRMEEVGVKLDVAALEEAGREVAGRLAGLEEEIFAHAGCRWNLNAPHATATVLYTKLGLECPKLTPAGQPSADAEALEELVGHHPVVAPLLEWRECNKLAQSFIETLPALADERGRVHPHYDQVGSGTGRFTCKLPNLQQVPKSGELGRRLRQAFIAEAGNVLVVADYSQQELRVLAHFARDPQLLAAFESGADLHTRTATLMFGKSEGAVTPQERDVGKLLNFGVIYGIAAHGLHAKLSHDRPGLTVKDCEQFIAGYFRAYPGVRRLLDRIKAKARERGYVRTLLGRRRRMWARDSREARQVCNAVIQGSAADITKTAMVSLAARLPEGAELVCCVHDELVIECGEAQAEEVRELTVEAMRSAVPDGFTALMAAEAKIGASWGDCK